MSQKKNTPTMDRPPKFNKEDVYFLPLGGSGEIGMNLNLYHYQGKWLMVDLGVSFDKSLGMDVVMPDTTFIENHLDDLEGLVITHGHEDHIGAIPYIWHLLQCPIYATPFTAFLIRRKLKEAGLLGEATIIEIDPGDSVKLGQFDVTFVPLTHSIPEANALWIQTPKGSIFHTGDWKLDPNPQVGSASSIEMMKDIGATKPLALVCDSTNIFSEGRSGSEGDVKDSLVSLIQNQKQRVVVACFASNVARLQTCLEAAHASGRKIILAGRSLWNMSDAAVHCGYFQSNHDFLKDGSYPTIDRDKVLLVCTGSQGEPRAALSRIANGTHPKIKLEPGDTVIYSSREIPGNESVIHQAQESLLEQNVNVITDYDEMTHVSGHPNQDELKDVYQWIQPEILIPVHGESNHLREHVAFGLAHGIPKAMAPKNGVAINLSGQNSPEKVGTVTHGRLAVDGHAIVHVNGEHLKSREKLSQNGVVFTTLTFDKKGRLHKPTETTIIGLPDIGQDGSLYDDLQLIIEEDVETILQKKSGDDDYLKERLEQSIKKFIGSLLSKKPVVAVHIVR